jgi:hypothetical protein
MGKFLLLIERSSLFFQGVTFLHTEVVKIPRDIEAMETQLQCFSYFILILGNGGGVMRWR